MKTLTEELKDEEELMRRRFVHATRPKGPMSMEEAQALCERMEGKNVRKNDPNAS